MPLASASARPFAVEVTLVGGAAFALEIAVRHIARTPPISGRFIEISSDATNCFRGDARAYALFHHFANTKMSTPTPCDAKPLQPRRTLAPPSTGSVTPVTKLASSDARNSAALATS